MYPMVIWHNSCCPSVKTHLLLVKRDWWETPKCPQHERSLSSLMFKSRRKPADSQALLLNVTERTTTATHGVIHYSTAESSSRASLLQPSSDRLRGLPHQPACGHCFTTTWETQAHQAPNGTGYPLPSWDCCLAVGAQEGGKAHLGVPAPASLSLLPIPVPTPVSLMSTKGLSLGPQGP